MSTSNIHLSTPAGQQLFIISSTSAGGKQQTETTSWHFPSHWIRSPKNWIVNWLYKCTDNENFDKYKFHVEFHCCYVFLFYVKRQFKQSSREWYVWMIIQIRQRPKTFLVAYGVRLQYPLHRVQFSTLLNQKYYFSVFHCLESLIVICNLKEIHFLENNWFFAGL